MSHIFPEFQQYNTIWNFIVLFFCHIKTDLIFLSVVTVSSPHKFPEFQQNHTIWPPDRINKTQTLQEVSVKI